MRSAHLHARLAEVDAPGELLAHEGVGVVRALEHALQRLQLAAVERGAVPPLLLLPLGGAAAPRARTLTCGRGASGVSRRRSPCARGGAGCPEGHNSGTGHSPCVSLRRWMDGPAPRAGALEVTPCIPSFTHPFIPQHVLTEQLLCDRRSARARGEYSSEQKQSDPYPGARAQAPAATRDK